MSFQGLFVFPSKAHSGNPLKLEDEFRHPRHSAVLAAAKASLVPSPRTELRIEATPREEELPVTHRQGLALVAGVVFLQRWFKDLSVLSSGKKLWKQDGLNGMRVKIAFYQWNSKQENPARTVYGKYIILVNSSFSMLLFFVLSSLGFALAAVFTGTRGSHEKITEFYRVSIEFHGIHQQNEIWDTLGYHFLEKCIELVCMYVWLLHEWRSGSTLEDHLVEELCSWKSYSICMQNNSAVHAKHIHLLGLHEKVDSIR